MLRELSPRASAYVDSLDRGPALPIEEVETLLLAAEAPAVPLWLDFHGRYGGRVMPLGLERAILGIAHPSDGWTAARTVSVDHDADGWWVECADSHPSNWFMLGESGEFLGASCRTFETYLEQNALWAEVARQIRSSTGRAPRYELDASAPDVQERLSGELRRVPEASDKVVEVHVGEGIAGLRHVADGRWGHVMLAD